MEYIKTVCKIGQGEYCCRYITVGKDGFRCEKHSQLKAVIDARVEHGQYTSKGDNCQGFPDTVDLLKEKVQTTEQETT